jgi:DnaJ-class molecular chaperone
MERKCEACDGHGVVFQQWEEEGPPIPSDCDGAGDHYIWQREEWVQCDKCDGTGVIKE